MKAKKTQQNNCLTSEWIRRRKMLMYHFQSILNKAKPGSKNYMLCLTEKYHILFLGLNFLNNPNVLISKCRHENK